MTAEEHLILVARIGKPHGLRGEVTVQLHTDDPDRRLAVGAELACDPQGHGPLCVASVRVHQGRYLVGFTGVDDRNEAEALRNTRLFVSALEADGSRKDHRESQDEDEFYEDELIGMKVLLLTGEEVGHVSALHTRTVQDLLEVTHSNGTSTLVPFVTELVPTVDREHRRILIDPPAGLLDLGP